MGGAELKPSKTTGKSLEHGILGMHEDASMSSVMTDSDNKPPGNSHFSLTVKGSEFGLSSASMSSAIKDLDNKPPGNRHFSLTGKGSEFGLLSASMSGAETNSDNKPVGNRHFSLTE
jgi:hypothetical protein